MSYLPNEKELPIFTHTHTHIREKPKQETFCIVFFLLSWSPPVISIPSHSVFFFYRSFLHLSSPRVANTINLLTQPPFRLGLLKQQTLSGEKNTYFVKKKKKEKQNDITRKTLAPYDNRFEALSTRKKNLTHGQNLLV